ncbi:MAG: DUF1569 domain-containing protein [Planctomycetaceae bacterium]
MPVNTSKVQGRRQVQYDSYEDLLADAEQLANSNVKTLGNWSFGQILLHVAQSTDSSLDGSGFALPAPVRWIFTLLMKQKFLTKPIPAGFKAPKRFQPQELSVEESIVELRKAIARQYTEEQRAMHPAFGMISKEEWTQFNLRHAEMHMSFVVLDDHS